MFEINFFLKNLVYLVLYYLNGKKMNFAGYFP